MAEKNISNKEALEKLRSIVDQIDIGTLCSFNKESDYPHGVPMSRQEADDDGSIWYICSAESETFRNIENDPKISLFYADAKNYTFLSINGTGRLSRDQARIDRYWNKMMEGWFEKGKEDPNIQVLKIVPNDAYYWDQKSNKLITLMKVAANAVTGNNFDVGRDGKLSI